ncbi:hypothetical protein UlMin_030903 [Ulmus minor]
MGFPGFEQSKHDFESIEIDVRQIFPNAKVFKKAVTELLIQQSRQVKLIKNDKRRVRYVCKSEIECPLYVYALMMDDGIGFQINFAKQLRDDTHVDVSRWNFYRAWRFASRALRGDAKEQFGILWDYCNELKRSNPGTTVKIQTRLVGSEVRFERIYICFDACKQGYMEGCRPLVGLDGCHLKGNHKGQILSTVGIDPNNSMFPIAFSVVEAECKDSWRYMARRIEAKRIKGSKWKHVVGPRIWKLLQKTQQQARYHDVDYHGDLQFEVRTRGLDQYIVNLNSKHYACRKWELSGLPCSHAMACIIHRGLQPTE